MNYRLIKRRQVDEGLVKKRFIADAMEAYLGWRQECISVGDAYVRWARAPAADAGLAFAAYGAALDREEQAERLYAGVIGTSPQR